MSDKIAQHPDGVHEITFHENPHAYVDNEGSRYVSCTSFIKPFFPVFDAVAVSEKCSVGTNPKYTGRDPVEIMREWAIEALRGRSEGDNIHLYAEKKDIEPISDRCALLFNQVDKVKRIFFKKGFKFIASEMIVFSPDLLLAGSIDLIMWDPATQEVLILDWKQNKEITTRNLFKKNNGLYPIEHLEGSDKNKYSLQLSFYQYLIMREKYFPQAKGYRRALIHLTPTAAIPIKLEYLDFEIKEMLKCHKRMNN